MSYIIIPRPAVSMVLCIFYYIYSQIPKREELPFLLYNPVIDIIAGCLMRP